MAHVTGLLVLHVLDLHDNVKVRNLSLDREEACHVRARTNAENREKLINK
jgi:hypothetical protein